MAANDSRIPEHRGSANSGPNVRSFEVIPEMSALAPLRRNLTAHLPPSMPREDLDLYLVAVTEAVTNAIEAHRRDGVADVVMVHLDLDRGVVSVDDRAGGIDRDRIDSVVEPLEVSPSAQRGRGMLIMRGICPDMRVESTPAGTRVVLPFPTS